MLHLAMTLSSGQRATLAELFTEYGNVLEEQRQRNIHLAQLRTAINALVALDTDEPITYAGTLADACRAVLKNSSGRPLTPLQVRDAIIALGYNLAQHKSNPLASIHAVLKRLSESGDVERAITEAADGKKAEACYFWTGRAEAERLVGTFDPSTYPDLSFMSSGSDAANVAIHAHRAHNAGKMAAIHASISQNAYNPALHIDTDKKKEK